MKPKRAQRFLKMSVEQYRKLALENPLRAAVVEYLRLRGYVVSVTDAALRVCPGCGRVSGQSVDTGWPDVTACEPGTGRLVAVETKTVKGKLRPSQVRCLETLRAAGAVVCVARSLDDLQNVIEKRRDIER
jgi:hypothetical protein